MDFFQYKNNQLMAENLPVKQLAEQFGTPLYVYSKATLERHWHAFNNAFGEHPPLVCCSEIQPEHCDFKRNGKIRIRL